MRVVKTPARWLGRTRWQLFSFGSPRDPWQATDDCSLAADEGRGEAAALLPRGALLLLDTSIDLEGNACRQRLLAEREKLVVVDDIAGTRREWPVSQIQDFRGHPSVGSCFLQVRVEGSWVDILRRPGSVDPELNHVVEWLDSHHQEAGWRDVSGEAGMRRAPNTSPDGVAKDLSADTARARTAARMLPFLRPFRGSVLLLLALSVGVVAIELLPPALQGILVDRVLRVPSNSGAPLLFYLLAIVMALLCVRLTSAVANIWKGIVGSRVGASMTANLRNALVEKLNALPLAFHDRNRAGALMSRVAYDTETLHTLVYHMTSGFLVQVLQLSGIGVMLVWYNPELAAMALLPMPWIVAGTWYFTRYLQPRHHHYWEAVGKQASGLLGMLSGIRVVKSFVQEPHEIQRFGASSDRLRDSRLRVDIATLTFTALMGFLFALGGLAVWYMGGRYVLAGRMTIGDLMAFLGYVAMFYAPLTSIAESTSWLASFASVSRRICDLLDTAEESRPVQPPAPVEASGGRIEFQNVSFGYDKNRPVLEDISFAVAPCEMVGVVGRSGSGKSTLVSLVNRLYEVDRGRVLIDGMDVRSFDPQQLRRAIGMVPQEPFLFRGSVADNIAYGHPHASPERVLVAARQADAHHFIMRMPLAYDTQLGEGGTGLSGGEKQRISIARALLFDPAILILDEATASVDAESEKAICDALRREVRRRTTLIIAHRLSTLRNADRLLVIDQGRLIEQGTPQELLAQEGLYRSLARLQGHLDDGREAVERIFAATASNSPGDSAGTASGTGATRNSPGREGGECMREVFRGGCWKGIDATGTTGHKDERPAGWLDPAVTSVEGDDAGKLTVRIAGQAHLNVWALGAFPAGHPDRWISLWWRQAGGAEAELGMIRGLGEWPAPAQAAVRRSLARGHLFCRVREIRQIRTRGQELAVSVRTDRGIEQLRFEKAGEGCQPFGPRGLLLLDPAGNYYVVDDRQALPKRQRQLLSLYFGG